MNNFLGRKYGENNPISKTLSHIDAIWPGHWRNVSKIIRNILISLIVATSTGVATAQQGEPSIGFESLLNAKMFDNGIVNLNGHDLIFAPPTADAITSTIKTTDGKLVVEYQYYSDYRAKEAVFGKLNPKGIPQHQFEPGNYVFEFAKDGEVFTRFQFSVLTDGASDDPFSPQLKVYYEGPWQKFAYFYFQNAHDFTADKDVKAVYANFWAGTSDVPAGQQRVMISVKLTRDGKLVAHSRETDGMIQTYPVEKFEIPLFHPHERSKSANAQIFNRTDLEQNGTYRLIVELQEGQKIIRDYQFKSADGKVIPHPRTELGYEPHVDYIAPRVFKKGSTTYEFEEAIWIESKK